ncbi:hypothetical protein [Mycolicibacterium fallax]|uniref:hypothetical protein n=1 Tax=Mycolicibacterium fallax TaxID=1793 RepID=UPI000A14F68D|nr:hypothetical protein [Mycolicibacterium fallax]BBY98572.1 hypothetical protein MFAL_20390 [Mycolicibacterium fallax]
MGIPAGTSVDLAAVDAVAGRFNALAAGLAECGRNGLSRLLFDGVTAGRAHLAAGQGVRRAVDPLAAELAAWALAAAEIGAGLSCGARRYRDAEAAAAAGLR